MPSLEKAVRDRLFHYLSQEVAQVARLTLEHLPQVAIGRIPLEKWQIDALARRMHLKEKIR